MLNENTSLRLMSWIFDKIYVTKDQMDANANTDGVLYGRYVLISHDYTSIDVSDDQYDGTIWVKERKPNSSDSIYVQIANIRPQGLQITASCYMFFEKINANFASTKAPLYGYKYTVYEEYGQYEGRQGYKYSIKESASAPLTEVFVSENQHFITDQPETYIKVRETGGSSLFFWLDEYGKGKKLLADLEDIKTRLETLLGIPDGIVKPFQSGHGPSTTFSTKPTYYNYNELYHEGTYSTSSQLYYFYFDPKTSLYKFEKFDWKNDTWAQAVLAAYQAASKAQSSTPEITINNQTKTSFIFQTPSGNRFPANDSGIITVAPVWENT